jgi:hypothetical protein
MRLGYLLLYLHELQEHIVCLCIPDQRKSFLIELISNLRALHFSTEEKLHLLNQFRTIFDSYVNDFGRFQNPLLLFP